MQYFTRQEEWADCCHYFLRKGVSRKNLPTRLKVALHPSVAAFAPEVKYVFSTLLRVAGYAHEFVWTDPSVASDIYFGPDVEEQAPARVRIHSTGDFRTADRAREPRAFFETVGLGFISFDADSSGPVRHASGAVSFRNDLVRSCYWLLTGAMDAHYPRDRWDNLQIQDSFLVRHKILQRPLVSEYGQFLREFFSAAGKQPEALPWMGGGKACVFGFSHDVDYPQMIKWVECLRLLQARGAKAWPSIAGIVSGASHFWKFADWIEFEKKFDTRPAFYFSAVCGSLLRYVSGTPDVFYDIGSADFRELFKLLREEGCEIGLHASYNAFQSAEQLCAERQRLQELSGAAIAGNRHHYWRLNPDLPEETLARHEAAGFSYDSSLGFELFPGWRRGICHPFRPYHPTERRALKVLQLPPAWMDDHFHRRLAVNAIASPEEHARALLAASRRTCGVVVVDYHARGMNSDFFPSYGPWLKKFLESNLGADFSCRRPVDIAAAYGGYERALEGESLDRATEPAAVAGASSTSRGAAREEEAVEVGPLRADQEAAWEEFVRTQPDATIYHSLAWRAVTQEGLGHRPYYLCATSASGECLGALPLFLVSGVFGKRLVSVPLRDRAGLVADSEAVADRLLATAVALKEKLGAPCLELRSLHGLSGALARKHGLVTRQGWVTSRIDLSIGREKLWKALDKNAIRWAIGKAEREGATFTQDATREGMRRFFDMFCRTRQQMGIPVFPFTFFEAIWRHVIQPGRGSLFFVTVGETPIHALICFHSGDTFIPAYAAPQNPWRKLYPSEFIIWRTIERAVERGFRCFDFGADSRRQTGLLFFKSKWGSVQQPISYEYSLSGKARVAEFDSSSRTYEMARKAWRLLPRPIAIPLGGWVTRQLS